MQISASKKAGGQAEIAGWDLGPGKLWDEFPGRDRLGPVDEAGGMGERAGQLGWGKACA